MTDGLPRCNRCPPSTVRDDRRCLDCPRRGTPQGAGPLSLALNWVDCPICGESDMHCETFDEGATLIRCTNHGCPSNKRSTPAPASWPQDAPPLPHPELLGSDGMDTPSKAEIKAAMEADERPAPDAVREALKKRMLAYRQNGGKLFNGWTVATDFEALVALAAPVPPAGDPEPECAPMRFTNEVDAEGFTVSARLVPVPPADGALSDSECREIDENIRSALVDEGKHVVSGAGAAELVAWDGVVTGEMQDAFDNALPRREDARHPNDRDKPLYNALADGDVFTKAFCAALALATPPVRGDRESNADDIRAHGWTVAVHNDYRQGGEAHTFWLFTNGRENAKGEGKTDAEALNQVRAILSLPVQPGDPNAVPMTAELAADLTRRAT